MAKNTPGKDITKSQEAQRKLKNTTETINKISSFAAVGIGIEYNDGIGAIRTIIERLIEGPLFEATQDLKQQQKDRAFDELRKRGIPTSKPEARELFREKILEKRCDIEIMNIVKETKNTLESILTQSNSKLENVIKKLERIQTKVDKALNSLVDISVLLGIFQTLIIALKILVTSLSLALIPLAGFLASAAIVKKINDGIVKANAFILKYGNAIQVYTGYALKTLQVIISLVNLLPLVIDVIKNLASLIQNFINTLNNYYKQYIENCIPGGDVINPDGTLNIENIDKFLNFNTPTVNLKPDVLGDYIRDDEEQRIFRPKIN